MKRRDYPWTTFTALAVAVALLATTTLASARPSHADRVEARIKELHVKLHITPTQEDLWNNVTAMMRDNAQTLDALTQTRVAQAQTMTAVDDLKSYSAITAAHAEGLKKFIPVFETLYVSMSDAQKKNADTLFRNRVLAQAKNH